MSGRVTNRGVVIVGGGPAGWSCAFGLRARDFKGSITLLGEEPRTPYDRTLVSKDCLVRDPGDHDLRLADEREYIDAGLNLRLGVAAISLDVERRLLALADGCELGYESLVLATGGTPRAPASLMPPGVHTLRTLTDARRLRMAFRGARRLVIVGGGFIAGEAASAARAAGLEVVMVEALDGPLVQVLGTEAAESVAQLHHDEGVTVLVRTRVEAIRGEGDGYVVGLQSAGTIEGDVVLVAIGSRPAVDWLTGTPGIALDDGIVTDEHCRTGVPGIYAIGDCARWPSGRTGLLTRVEHWETAIEHGAAAAAAIVGGTEPFAPVPFVWSIQHGSRLQWVGEGTGWDSVEISRKEGSRGLVARYSRAGELCAGFAIDDPRGIATIRRELAARKVTTVRGGKTLADW
jgi:NADPH-dependent 2,4-dienoyl-CoA reductase/sulfur reductase-like enzyme